MKTVFALIVFFSLNLGLQAKPIKVMLLTGQTDKYHKWEVTSRYLKATLDYQGLFSTDEVLIPSPGKELDEFVPEFSKYKVVVLSMNIPCWNEKAMKAFVNFVKNGGGVVVIHEADNAFINDKEYNKMIGLGGWGGLGAYPKWQESLSNSTLNWKDRNEKSGPYYYWKNGEYVTDNTSGPGGSHGKRVPFVINIRDTEHPITKGLPGKWLHQNDELYGSLRGPAENIHMLATAFSTKESGGTGKEEPVLFTISYGKGRIYHCVLGHTSADYSDSVQDVGFQVTFSRGTEWAATGKVKQKLPAEFPTEITVLLYDLEKLKSKK